MPELPEVETIAQEMREHHLVGKTIIQAQVFWDRTVATPKAAEFEKLIVGQVITNIGRRGKFLVFTLTSLTLLVHLRMTGKFTLSSKRASPLPYERVRLALDNGQFVHYEDQRKFGKWYLLAKPEMHLARVGLEPLSNDFTLKAFVEILNGRKTQIKPFLLNQRYIAGIGNIYADEALWEAKIHPKRPINTLTKSEVTALHKAIPKVLLQGIAHQGTTLGSSQANYFSVSGRRGGNQYKLNVFRREGQPCPRCGEILQKMIVGQRGTHFCPRCQK